MIYRVPNFTALIVLCFLIAAPGCFFKKHRESLESVERRLALLEAEQRETRREVRQDLDRINKKLDSLGAENPDLAENEPGYAVPEDQPEEVETDSAHAMDPTAPAYPPSEEQPEIMASSDESDDVEDETPEPTIESESRLETGSQPEVESLPSVELEPEIEQPVAPSPEPDPPLTNGEVPFVAMEDVGGLYKEAMASYNNKSYEQAQQGFASIAQHQPDHALAPNALYWMAETQYDRNNFKLAASWFQNVVERYPESRKAPDALLKFGKSHERLGNYDMAQKAYERVIADYGDSRSAGLARDWL